MTTVPIASANLFVKLGVVSVLLVLLCACEESERIEIGGQFYCVPRGNLLEGVPEFGSVVWGWMTEGLPAGKSFWAELIIDTSYLLSGESSQYSGEMKSRKVEVLVADVDEMPGHRSITHTSELGLLLNSDMANHEVLGNSGILRSIIEYSGSKEVGACSP